MRHICKANWYRKELSKRNPRALPSWGYDKAMSYLVIAGLSKWAVIMLKWLVEIRHRIYNIDQLDQPRINFGKPHELFMKSSKGKWFTFHAAGHRSNSFCTITTEEKFGKRFCEQTVPFEYAVLIAGLVSFKQLFSYQQHPTILSEMWKESITMS